MGRVLTNEEIADLLAPKPKVKDKPQVVRFPAPPQHGPLRYVDVSSLCVVSGYWVYDDEGNRTWKKTHGACRTQTNYRLNGIPMCCTHAIRTMNDMLHDAGFEFTGMIIDEKTAEQIDHEEMSAQLIRGNENLLNRLKKMHELIKNGEVSEAEDDLDAFLLGVNE